MEPATGTLEHRVHLTQESAERLRSLAARHEASEDQIVARAIELLYNLTAAPATDPESGNERQAFSAVSEGALARVWDNDEDAAYDDWRKLYGVSAR